MDSYKVDHFLAIAEIVIGTIFLFLAFASCFVEVPVHSNLVFFSLSVGFQALAQNRMRR